MKKSPEESPIHDHEKIKDQADKWMLGDIYQQLLETQNSEQSNSHIQDEKTSTTGSEGGDAKVLSIEEQSEQQLVHALLLQRYASETAYNAYVDRGMEKLNSIEDNKLKAGKRAVVIPFYTLWGGMAASFILCMLVFLVVYPSNSAIAAMDEVIDRLADMGDRLYSLGVEDIKHGKHAKNIKKRKLQEENRLSSAKSRRKGFKPRFRNAELYLRGADEFVLIEKKDNGRGFVKGSNGIESWQISDNGNTLTTGDVGSTKLPLSSNARALVFLDIAASLNNLKSGYTISMQEDQVLPGVRGALTKITAEKIDRKTKGAKRVVLYFHPNSYDIQRLVFDRVHLPGDRARVKITLDLLSSDPLPEDFFDASAHYTIDKE